MKKETVLARLDIRAFYAEAMPSLRDTGMGEATGLCPFHDDNRPSLSVNLETGLWKCVHRSCIPPPPS